MKRRTLFLTLATFPLALVIAGCSPEKPRALILADGTGAIHNVGVAARAKAFEQLSGRQVRVLPVAPAQAVLLASRGEADVAVITSDASIDTFLASDHGRVAGVFNHGGERLRVLEVNAKQHPKVEAKGAQDLASALTAP